MRNTQIKSSRIGNGTELTKNRNFRCVIKCQCGGGIARTSGLLAGSVHCLKRLSRNGYAGGMVADKKPASRHGRAVRSDARGIAAADAGGRTAFFVDVAKDVINYLCDVQPAKMNGVRVEMASLPSGELADGLPRMWSVIPAESRVIVYRLPIERMTKLHRADDWHRRNNIESAVIEAIAELVGEDPYEFAPKRYFPHS